jgi:protein gp37
MDKTKIEWTDTTWNPIRGCSRVSEGCRNCYAERIAARFSKPGEPYAGVARQTKAGGRWTGEVTFIEAHLADPMKWKHPRKVFVNSMSDLFHEAIPNIWVDKIFLIMMAMQRHTFQILTKRPERMRDYCASKETLSRIARFAVEIASDIPGVKFSAWNKPDGFTGICLPNVWLGVSVEDQATADARIPLLLQTPAEKRFISYEPALGAVNLHEYIHLLDPEYWSATNPRKEGLLHWVICGGESGPGARPMHPAWARSVRDQCAAAGVPFFFKQWGEWRPITYVVKEKGESPPLLKVSVASPETMKKSTREIVFSLGTPESSVNMLRVGKRKAGRSLDGREWNDMPETRT